MKIEQLIDDFHKQADVYSSPAQVRRTLAYRTLFTICKPAVEPLLQTEQTFAVKLMLKDLGYKE